MVLTGGAVASHASMILDPNKEGSPEGSAQLHEGMMEMWRQIHTLAVSLLVVVTPHGICLEDDVGVYMNKRGAGAAEWNGHWAEFKVDVELSDGKARELLDAWKSDGVKCQGIHMATMSPCQLTWAEIIPIWMLQQWGYREKIVIVSAPHSNISGGMATDPKHLDNLYGAGSKLAEYCDTGIWKNERVFLCVSGHLAHTHPTTATNPLYLPAPYWDMPTNGTVAAEFDRRFEEWALDARRGRSLAERCLELERAAMSCALRGALILEGAMHEQERRGNAYLGKMAARRRTPTYFTIAGFLFTQHLYPTTTTTCDA